MALHKGKHHARPFFMYLLNRGKGILGQPTYGSYPILGDILPRLSLIHIYAATMNQLFAAYSRGKEAKELAVILGEAALSDIDKQYAAFADAFEKEYVSQGYETNRSIEETLDLGWKLLSMLPRTELKRIRDDMLDEFLPKKEETK